MKLVMSALLVAGMAYSAAMAQPAGYKAVGSAEAACVWGAGCNASGGSDNFCNSNLLCRTSTNKQTKTSVTLVGSDTKSCYKSKTDFTCPCQSTSDTTKRTVLDTGSQCTTD